MATIETLHHKFITKLSLLENIGSHMQGVINIYIKDDNWTVTQKPKQKNMSYAKYMDLLVGESSRPHVDKTIIEVARIKAIYNTGASPLLSIYYDSFTTVKSDEEEEDSHKDSQTLQQSVYNDYITFIMSENILDKMDQCMTELLGITQIYQRDKDFRKFIETAPSNAEQRSQNSADGDSQDLQILQQRLMTASDVTKSSKSYKDFFIVFQKYCDEYVQNKLVLPVKKELVNDCSCGGKMTILQDTSELRCDDCGMIVTLEGTVFEDSQFYTQQGQCTKHKKYDAKRHCKKWLDQIQAKENKTFPPELTEALSVRARLYYTRNGKLRTMARMKCSQIRDWLKEEGQTDFNPHAPLLRKIITSENGKAVIPPQLRYDEEQRILVLFSNAMDVYDQLMEEKLTNVTNNRRPNKPYYPYVLFKILHIVLKKGPRLDGLIECIHLQSDGTLKNHDTIWKKICELMSDEKEFTYKPTDRTILLDVF